MPTVQINFLRQRRKQFTQTQKSDVRYAKILGGVMGVVVVAAAVVFVIDFFVKRQLTEVKEQEREYQRQIAQQAAVEQEYLILAKKFVAIKEILEGKTQKQQALEYFIALFAKSNITLSEMDLTDDNILHFHVSAVSIFDYRQLLTAIESAEVRLVYPQIGVSDLARAKAGDYTSIVSVQLVDPKPTKAPARPRTPATTEETSE
jgi:hypothetical protein